MSKVSTTWHYRPTDVPNDEPVDVTVEYPDAEAMILDVISNHQKSFKIAVRRAMVNCGVFETLKAVIDEETTRRVTNVVVGDADANDL